MNQLQYKLVFIEAVDLHQFSSRLFAGQLGLVPILDGAAHKVAVAFKLHPESWTLITYNKNKQKSIFSLVYSLDKKSKEKLPRVALFVKRIYYVVIKRTVDRVGDYQPK